MENRYNDTDLVNEKVQSGLHRQFIGGKWEELGKLQFDFMKSIGLLPANTLLDVGCGSLRGGLHFLSYLEAGHYYGFDVNRSLIDAGINVEVKKNGLGEKINVNNFFASEDFVYPEVWSEIDYAIGFSLVTHLGADSTLKCLKNTAFKLKPEGRFYVTVFEVPEDSKSSSYKHVGGIETRPDKDPYHYSYVQLEELGERAGLTLLGVDPFNHPRSQKMATFMKLGI